MSVIRAGEAVDCPACEGKGHVAASSPKHKGVRFPVVCMSCGGEGRQLVSESIEEGPRRRERPTGEGVIGRTTGEEEQPAEVKPIDNEFRG